MQLVKDMLAFQKQYVYFEIQLQLNTYNDKW